MDLTSLKTVLLVHSQGSIAGAARILGLDPSSVSRIVAMVEADFRIRLFHRTTRKLTATEEGAALLSRLSPLLDEFTAAREEARGLQSTPTGHLRMTASVAFTHEVLIPLLPEFQSLYPDVTLQLRSDDANLDLVENAIDLAVRLAPAPKGDLISTRLIETRYHAVASPDFVASCPSIPHPNDLSRVNCLKLELPGHHQGWTFRQPATAPFGVTVGGNVTFSNPLTLRQAAITGLGVAMLADWLVADDLREGRLVQLCPEFESTASTFDTAAWALYPNRSYLPHKVRVMIDFLKRSLRAKHTST